MKRFFPITTIFLFLAFSVAYASPRPTGSLDCTKIVFATDRDGNSEVYVMNSDGSNPINLTNHPATDSVPAWSPDGCKIAFASDRDGDFDIWVMNADGTTLFNVTNNSGYDVNPSWSPDSSRIVFESAPDTSAEQEIWVINADGTNPINLTNHPAGDGDPDWSPVPPPDGREIAFQSIRSGSNEIWAMKADGTDPVNLTNNGVPGDGTPDWSPDGTKIAYFYMPPGGNGDIYVMNYDGTGKTPLTNDGGDCQSPCKDDSGPSWSPDGTRIAFMAYRDGNYEIYTMNADGTNPVRLTDHPATDANPSWSPFLVGAINGHVTDKVTGKPIPQAIVIAIQKPAKVTDVTDKNGYYELKDLQCGFWLVICIKKGYKTGIAKVEVKVCETITKDFKLSPKSVGDDEDEFADLHANYPNPFNPDTWIPYSLSQDADVTIRIFNSAGQLVRTLDLGGQVAGIYIDKDKAAYWDGKDDLGQQVASGVYYYTIQAGNFSATRKMVIVK